MQPRHAKAKQKVKSIARSRVNPQNQQVLAADVKLQDGYFYNADGTAASILQSPFAGCSGVCIQDFHEAAHSMEAFHSLDELAVIVIGHRCPHAASCAGRVAVPALNAASEPVILAACMHSWGIRQRRSSVSMQLMSPRRPASVPLSQSFRTTGLRLTGLCWSKIRSARS